MSLVTDGREPDPITPLEDLMSPFQAKLPSTLVHRQHNQGGSKSGGVRARQGKVDDKVTRQKQGG